MKRLPVEDLEHIFYNSQDVWESFREKSIFLTGGTGFFGKWILESFIYVNEKLALNARLTTLSRDPESFLKEFSFYNDYSSSVRFVKGDILSFDFNLEDEFQYIIHAATSSDESANLENPINLADSIILGTKNVLNFAIKNPIISFLNISSGAVYGISNQLFRLQENELSNIDLYGSHACYNESKRASEMYSSLFYRKYNLPIKTARCFAFIGPHLPLNKHFAVGNFINNILKKQDIIINSNGRSIRSYMYMSDLIVWLITILVKGDSNTFYNVGSDKNYSIKEVALMMTNNSNSSVIVNDNTNKNIESIYVPNIEKSQSLGLSVTVDLIEAIQKTIKFYND